MRRLAAALGATVVFAVSAASSTGAEFDKHALKSVSASAETTQAGERSDFTTSFEVTMDSFGEPFALLRDAFVDLPPGLVANLNAVPKCTTLQLGVSPETSQCPQDSQVGVVEISLSGLGTFSEPLYLMEPPPNRVARLGFMAALFPAIVNVELRSESDYGATASAEGVSAAYPVERATTTIWGVPADPSHDEFRVTPMEALNEEAPPGGGRKSGLPPAPFMVNPTRCGVALAVTTTINSYQLPLRFSTMSAPVSPFTGCESLGFAPSFSATPSSREASSPTGLEAVLTIPQDETANGLATSHLRHARITFPPGLTIAPGAADGQQACSDAEAGYRSRRAAQCPNASKLGTAELDVPALERPLKGGLYLRTPVPGNLFRVWLIADDLGVHLAIPGELEVDKSTGQITSAFLELPEAPLAQAKVQLSGGPRAPLATPSVCGAHLTRYSFTPWSGAPTVTGLTPMTVDQGCETGGFAPELTAGATNPVAGAFSPFVVRLDRDSKEQNVASLEVSPPAGLLAKLGGVSLCEGAAAQRGDCPAGSRIGRATVAVGPGASPLWLPQPGKPPIEVFLSGPYKGAPYSLLVRTPAQAGPFDLGTVLTRAEIGVNPNNARVTVASDPLPQILEGVPITYRTLHVAVDRRNFTINPTSCKESTVEARVTSAQGALAEPSARFQVGGCRELGFRPKLSLRLIGETSRGAHPKLRAVLRARKGDGNIRRVQVALPASEFLDQSHIRTVCTRVQFAAEACPKGSIYGRARAFTPLLDSPLKGNVYLRSSKNPLPDLVLALRGKVDINAVARIDSAKGGGLRATFAAIPDAPVTKVVVTMRGGDRGLLVNSRNLCQGVARASVELAAHSGKNMTRKPILRNDCASNGREKQPNHNPKGRK